MRIQNKYLRNRLAKLKARKRVVKFVGGEFSIKCYCPWWHWGLKYNTPSDQIIDHQEWIDKYWVRYLGCGGKGLHHKKWFRKMVERQERRLIQKSINKLLKTHTDDIDDIDIPKFKHDADWDWF